MSVLHWDECLSVHVEHLDQQHQGLLELANRLFDTGETRENIGHVIGQLLEYARIHFDTEEEYLLEIGYPGLVEHRQQHAEFLKQVAEFRARFLADTDGLTVHVMVFLGKWLRDHFAGADHEYSDFIANQGEPMSVSCSR